MHICQHRDTYTNRQALSPPRTLSEIQEITSSPVNDIAVLDPTLIPVQIIYQLLVNELNANIQLEFGVQSIIKKESLVIQRMNNLNSVKENSSLLRKNNIKFEISLIYRLPHQTVESFKESIEFAKTLGAEKVLLGFNVIESELPRERISEGIPHVVESPTFTKGEWREMMRIANELKVYVKVIHLLYCI
ncbi:unnamed protein product [Rhizophagus irregularis]|nr:unnamed protein product [Rhizophagus irregularis]